MPTFCACGNPISDRPTGFRTTQRPCLCKEPARPDLSQRAPTVFMRGHPRDPARARLGLPDRTETEKAVLKGTFHE